MKVEHFRYSGYEYKQTDGVSTLLPEDKIVDLYTIGACTRRPVESVQLHQTFLSAPVISITYAEPDLEPHGRDSTINHTFLVSLKDVTDALLVAIRPYFKDNSKKLEPLEIGKFTVSPEPSG